MSGEQTKVDRKQGEGDKMDKNALDRNGQEWQVRENGEHPGVCPQGLEEKPALESKQTAQQRRFLYQQDSSASRHSNRKWLFNVCGYKLNATAWKHR